MNATLFSAMTGVQGINDIPGVLVKTRGLYSMLVKCKPEVAHLNNELRRAESETNGASYANHPSQVLPDVFQRPVEVEIHIDRGIF